MTPTSDSPSLTRWLSNEAAAQYLGRSAITLRKWRAAGRGPAYRMVHGHAMYDRADLDAFMSEHTRIAVASPLLGAAT